MAVTPVISSHEFARGYTYLENARANSYTITNAERFLHFMLDTLRADAVELLIELLQRVANGRGDEHDVLAIELLQKRLVTERNENDR